MMYTHSLTCRESPESLVEGSETTFVIAGLGKFGHLALERLQNAYPHSRIIVLEQDAEKSARKFSPPVRVIEGDAVSLLLDSQLLHAEDFIIPMVPFNVAAMYVLARHTNAHEIAIPEEICGLLPNPLLINESNIVCSHADFVCPDDCPEGAFCTVTGKPREPLYDALRRLEVPGYNILVQKSLQILPGVGGYPLGDLHGLAQNVDKGRYLIATSCKCHGILTAILK
ncbi:MAG: hypothetical protein ACLP5H_16740 [Desulfomonilaceae bacterium]